VLTSASILSATSAGSRYSETAAGL
jgi:hypothetical protein